MNTDTVSFNLDGKCLHFDQDDYKNPFENWYFFKIP